MALALDEPKETDNVYEVNGLKFLVDKEFMEQAKPIKVDSTARGFQVSSSLKLEKGCGSGCGSSCG